MSELSASTGAVYGPVRAWLRAEGLSVFALSLLIYRNAGWSWWIFVALLLTPDLSMLAYLMNPKIGGACYNAVHSYVLPLCLAMVTVVLGGNRMAPYLSIACIWTAHIGMDRCLGYGLKYPTAFGRTHLGILGRPGTLAEAGGP